MREWLTVIIACLIIGVLLDGLRRMRAAKRNDMRMSLSMHKGIQKDDLEAYGSELPNGGARVVSKRDLASAKVSKPKAEPRATVAKASPKSAPVKSTKVVPAKQEELDLNQQVPLLMDVDEAPSAKSSADISEQDFQSVPADDHSDLTSDDVTERREPQLGAVTEELAGDGDIDDDAYDRVLFSGRPESVSRDPGEPTVKDADEPEEVFVVRVMAPKGEVFVGKAIKEAILGAGMRFGSRKIFHMHQDAAGEGPIQFSLVNMVQPGVFDLHRMDDTDTPGLSLFMTLPSDADSLPAYEAMVKTARKLSQELGGELRDDQLSTLTQQTIEHNRARVAEFERKRQLERARS